MGVGGIGGRIREGEAGSMTGGHGATIGECDMEGVMDG
jgi:hypothetical protein